MAKHYLDKLFRPSTLAIFGASIREKALGTTVYKNLIDANFSGKIYPINPKYKKVFQHRCAASLDDIHDMIDVAIITTPAKTIPNIVASCGKKGVENIIIISPGFSGIGTERKAFEKHILNIAEGYHIRVIGPDCLGIMRPRNQFNATYTPSFPMPGNLALISQSGTFTSNVIDWSVEKKIGFSTIASLGNNADIDFADILDYLTTDAETHSILLYIEGIRDARRFMSALRTAARMKPVILIKGGKYSHESHAAMLHPESILSEDHVFDVALHRAGAVRVKTIEELFLAAEILSHYQTTGNQLVIDSNACSFDAMARAFSYLASYQINQKLLLQVPEPFSLYPKPNFSLAKNIIKNMMKENRTILHRDESIMILQAFGIPTIGSESSPQHLKIGVKRDATFGPVISLEIEGDVMRECVYTLPPLNSFLARQLIDKTHIPQIIGANIPKIINILLRVSEMICEIPDIRECEIHFHEKTGEVSDVKIGTHPYSYPIQRYSHMAIHPYPNQLISTFHIAENLPVMIRPIKPEDAEMTQAFMRRLSSQSRYFRFMQHIRELTSTMLLRLTQIDYDREMTFIASVFERDEEKAIGLAHYVTNPDRESCEFAIVIADEWQSKGVGIKLMNSLTSSAKAQSLSIMVGFVIATNTSMLELTQRLGFVVSNSDDPTVKIVTRYL